MAAFMTEVVMGEINETNEDKIIHHGMLKEFQVAPLAVLWYLIVNFLLAF